MKIDNITEGAIFGSRGKIAFGATDVEETDEVARLLIEKGQACESKADSEAVKAGEAQAKAVKKRDTALKAGKGKMKGTGVVTHGS